MAVSIRKRAVPEFVEADCLVTDVAGDVVRISSDLVAGVYQVTKLDIASAPPEMALGVIISKATDTRCTVQVGGAMSGIYTGLTPGRPLFVGDDSRLTHAVPTRPATGLKSVYHAASALGSDVLFLSFQTPSSIRP